MRIAGNHRHESPLAQLGTNEPGGDLLGTYAGVCWHFRMERFYSAALPAQILRK